MRGKAKIAFGMTVLLLLCAAAFADGDDHRRGDYDGGYYAVNHEAIEQNRFYQQGVRDGHEDREHGRAWRIRDRRWDDRDDRDAYIAGYRAGFGSPEYGFRDPDDHYYGRRYQNQAYNFGFEDGLRIGRQDRFGGHSFRPTHGDRYDDADRGYDRSFGDKDNYKNTYRSGYMAGYQRGYNQGR
jgi:hypothetical protein